MKHLTLMLMLFAIAPSFAGQESEISYNEVDDSTKIYDKGDILMSAGGALFTSGAINSAFSSRIFGFGMMGAGGIIATIGGIIKIKNSVRKKKNGNRRS